MNLELIKEFKGHKDGVLSMAINGEILISGGEDNEINFWNLKNFTRINTIQAHKSDVTALAVLNENLISTSVDGLVKIWDIKTFSLLKELEGHKEKINSLDVLDNEIFITGGDDQTLKFWNINENSFFKSINFKIGDVKAVSAFKDKIAVGGSKLIICDKNGSKINENDEYIYGINFLRFSKDGKFLFVSGSMEKIFEIWDTSNFSKIKRVKDNCWINFANFYGEKIILAAEGYIKILNSQFQVEFEIEAHSDEIYALGVHNDLLISGGNDGFLKFWKIKN